ncbi:MAG: lipocalin family protein [Bacteroidota bacterium]
MKKVLFALLAVTVLVASSCSKDAKINRRLDGEWKVTSYDGKALASDETETYTFAKTDKLKGTGTYAATGTGYSINIPFTYTIGDEKITLVVDGTDADVTTVTTYEKKKMEFKDSDGVVTVLEPK